MNYFNSPISDNRDEEGDDRPAAFWPFVAGFVAPFLVALVVHFLFRG